MGISYDATAKLKEFSDANQISFPLLSDASSQVIKAFGIHDRDGYPHPGTYLVDQDGVVRAVLAKEGYRDRHSTEELIEAAQQLD